MNPEVTQATVVNTTPQLVFSGMGKVRFTDVGGNVRFGDSNVSAASSATWLDVTLPFDFRAPADVYAVCINSTSNQTAKVQVWF